jgi:simple sugar transport system ATP-binding protein
MNSENAIELRDITKRFPGIVANDHISFAVRKGEIHALAGENGAGKSTLMNILFGLLQPDEGTILINGVEQHFNTPRDSIRQKIGMVHQHFMLIPKMSVAENVILGLEPGSGCKVDRKEAQRQVQEISDTYELHIDAGKLVGDLSVPEQQRVEIIKVLYRQAELLIFDEPTAVLPPHLIDEFCHILLGLKKQGKTIIFISHKIAEVMAVSDRVTVIRRGKVIGTQDINAITADELTTMMVGHSIDTGRKARKETHAHNDALSLKNLHYVDVHGNERLRGLSLSVRKGEILGLAGVDGNGQEELEKCIIGLYKPNAGEIELNGKTIIADSVRKRREEGIAYVAEDRQKESLILSYSVADNLVLGQHYHEEFAKNRFWLKHDAIEGHAKRLAGEFDIRAASVDVRAGTLSGGNQQKIVIAREAYSDPELFVAIQPTRGLDIGASDAVQDTLVQIRNKGKAVLLISMELDEILAVSDRIAVIFEGKIVDVLDAASTTKEELGRLMLGAKNGRVKQ